MEYGIDDAQLQREQAEEQKIDKTSPIQLSIDSNSNYNKISLLYSSFESRPAADIVCVVDVSGSMASEATIQNNEGDIESKGLSILDIVKHAVKTIADNLKESDRMALVTFEDSAEVIFGLTKMDKRGKEKAFNDIDSLRDLGSTNLWDGVQSGLEVIRKESTAEKNQAILVFTDGMPNIVPPRGHIPMLKLYKEKNPEIKPVIHTYGFGYQMDSQLLDDIAQESSGNYSFIPDSSFVGTVFVNSLSNILPTMAKNIEINVELLNGAKSKEKTVLGGYQHLMTSWGIQIQLGTLQQGQSKDVILDLEILNPHVPYAQVTVKYLDLVSSKNKEITQEAIGQNDDISIEIQHSRLLLVDCIRNILGLMNKSQINEAKQCIEDFNKEINASQFVKSNEYVMDLLKDLNGQVSEAISRQDWYKKWGFHYLLSLMRAHLSQVCNNFKDPGVQHYGGQLFKDIRDKADEAFLKLPPPKPSKQAYIKKKNPQGQIQKIQVQQQSINMASYYDQRGGCFGGDCLIELYDGKQQKVSELKKGDKVKTGNGKVDKVVCLVETVCKNGVEFVSFEGGLKITSWHPIFINEKWQFPIKVNQNTLIQSSQTSIYSIVLENDYSIFINGIECVSLGHHEKTEILAHPYFGSEKVREDLKSMNGWDNGLVILTTPCVVTDRTTGLISKMFQNSIK